MGSKTPEGYQQGPPDHVPRETPAAIVLGPRKASAPDDELGGENDDDDGDDDGNGDGDEETSTAAVKSNEQSEDKNSNKKKKRKPRKKNKSKTSPAAQTIPPSIPITKLFPNESYPSGELQPASASSSATVPPRTLIYDVSPARISASELRANSNPLDATAIRDFRHAATVHRQVRAHVQSIAKPGASLGLLADSIEGSIRALLDNDGLAANDWKNSGLGFPTGLALNEIAAHWTPGPGSGTITGTRVLEKGDVLKVDFGVHVNGRIVDSAFTLAWDEKWDPLLAAVRAATNTGVKEAGVDARVAEIAAAVQEVMESYEVEVKPGVLKGVKAVRGLSGHDIKLYQIHGDKQVPFVKGRDEGVKMEEGEVYAIETFGSTGKGRVVDGPGVYGYGLNPDYPRVHLQLSSARNLLKTIQQQFGTIVFCRRYLERLGVDKYLLGLNSLVNNDILSSYPPLVDIEGSRVAQFEHTILLRSEAKEVVSRGDDY